MDDGILTSTFIDVGGFRDGDDHATAACCAPLGAPSLSDDQAEATARVFKALADPHRVRIVNLLATSPDPVCVCEFTGPLGLSQPTVSHHLKKLVARRAAGPRAARDLGLLLAAT